MIFGAFACLFACLSGCSTQVFCQTQACFHSVRLTWLFVQQLDDLLGLFRVYRKYGGSYYRNYKKPGPKVEKPVLLFYGDL